MAGLTAAVEELTADREHGASWMARRTVEMMLEVSEQPFETSAELFDALIDAGRRLAESRPGVGAIAGAAGRVLAAANAHTFLEPDQLRQLVSEEGQSILQGRERAAVSIAIQLRDRLADKIVMTHSASATVHEALLNASPTRAICTVSEPVGEGRAFAEELRTQGVDVELIDDVDGAEALRRCGSLPDRRRHRLPRRNSLQQDRDDRTRRGRPEAGRADDRGVRDREARADRGRVGARAERGGANAVRDDAAGAPERDRDRGGLTSLQTRSARSSTARRSSETATRCSSPRTPSSEVRAAALTLVALAATGCMSRSDSSNSDSSPTADLQISVSIRNSEAPSQAWTLHCPPGGTLPDAAAACRKLGQIDDPFAPVPEGTACTQIFGGPEIADVSGTFNGKAVDTQFSRGNGCELERWKRVGFLFPGVS